MAAVDVIDSWNESVAWLEVVQCNPALVASVIEDYASKPVEIDIMKTTPCYVKMRVSARVDDETNDRGEATDRVMAFYRWLESRLETLDQLAKDMRLLRQTEGEK